MEEQEYSLGVSPEVKALVSVLSAFVPPLAVIPAFDTYMQDRRDRQVRKLRAMDAAATKVYPGPPNELRDRLQSDERLRSMVDTAMDAAVRASTEAKARAIGRALVSGALAADDAQVDEAAQNLRIVVDLEAIDVRVLDHLTKLTWSLPPAPVATLVFDDNKALGHILASGLAAQVGISIPAANGALAVLQRHGLAGTVIRGDGTGWRTIPFGEQLLSFLRDRAADLG